jgi:choline kinase
MERTKDAVILAAGVGKRLGRKDQPKCLVEVGQRTLMERHLENLAAAEITRVVVVLGHGSEQIRERFGESRGNLQITYVENPEYRRGSVISLLLGLSTLPEEADVIWMDADVIYPARMLDDLAGADADLTFLLDETSKDTGEEMVLGVKGDRVLRIDRGGAEGFDLEGESVGFFNLSGRLKTRFVAHLRTFIELGGGGDEYEASVHALLPEIEARYLRVGGQPWTEIDFPEDLEKAERVLKALSS